MSAAATIPIPRPPGAVLFDMDGVLVDTFDAWVAVLEECRKRRALAPLGTESIRACWGQGINADCQTLFPGEDPVRLAAEYDLAFLRHLELVRAEPGVAATVRAVAAAGVPTAVVTNSPLALTKRIVETLGLGEVFTCFAAGDEVRFGKPDPELVFLALERAGSEPRRAVLVGDTRMDLEAARAAGVSMVGYRLDGAAARIEAMPELLPLLGISNAR